MFLGRRLVVQDRDWHELDPRTGRRRGVVLPSGHGWLPDASADDVWIATGNDLASAAPAPRGVPPRLARDQCL